MNLERKFSKSVRIYLIGLNEPFWNESCKDEKWFENLFSNGWSVENYISILISNPYTSDFGLS